jgi:hypothetical protein
MQKKDTPSPEPTTQKGSGTKGTSSYEAAFDDSATAEVGSEDREPEAEKPSHPHTGKDEPEAVVAAVHSETPKKSPRAGYKPSAERAGGRVSQLREGRKTIADRKDGSMAQPVIVDLGSLSRKEVRRLKRGSSVRIDEVMRVAEQAKVAGAPEAPIVVLYRKKARRRRGLRFPFPFPFMS